MVVAKPIPPISETASELGSLSGSEAESEVERTKEVVDASNGDILGESINLGARIRHRIEVEKKQLSVAAAAPSIDDLNSEPPDEAEDAIIDTQDPRLSNADLQVNGDSGGLETGAEVEVEEEGKGRRLSKFLGNLKPKKFNREFAIDQEESPTNDAGEETKSGSSSSFFSRIGKGFGQKKSSSSSKAPADDDVAVLSSPPDKVEASLPAAVDDDDNHRDNGTDSAAKKTERSDDDDQSSDTAAGGVNQNDADGKSQEEGNQNSETKRQTDGPGHKEKKHVRIMEEVVAEVNQKPDQSQSNKSSKLCIIL